ncbi:MAG TPA: PAS domain-containing hybrid sensor histidine kinase/response regulator [Steroidobacteraceae bacterium]|nr:PAS domain-containing hybrid sensor histidine kinase/response regulator [Steroidobacteraceae bacterium]
MVSGWLLSALAAGYLALLFAIAFFGDTWRVYPLNTRLRPVIYSLALGVYCTTWTFFGAVGTAVREGWAFLPIYLGPALLFLLGAPYLARLIEVARARNITSIADFISSRFGKSPSLAALVSLIALLAAVPYLALQYKAVAASIDVLTGVPASGSPWHFDTALAVALVMALFAALFGTRRVAASEHHEGLMLAIAFESLVKLCAFVAVGVYAWRSLGPAPRGIAQSLAAVHGSVDANFVATTLLAAAAVVCLPRQFQVAVVECAEPADLRRARWLFPLYVALFSVCVMPIAALGVASGLAEHGHPDTLVLTVPLATGAPWLALLAFLGGLSAATAMVIVASLALATMVTHDLIVPALWRTRLVRSVDLGGRILWLRRVAIFALALLAYGYHRSVGAPTSLASIGLLAFAAVAQFVPGIVAALWWRDATRDGVFWGLLAGFVVWIYTLMVPGVLGPASALLVHGPFGVEWLRPQALFGITSLGPVSQGALWALVANIAVLLAISLRRGTTLQERMAAKAFTAPLAAAAIRGGSHARVGDLEALAARIVGPAAARRMLAEHAERAQRPPPRPGDAADRALLQHVERELAGSVGASTARVLLTHALRRRGLEVDEVAELLDETSQELRFSRQLLQATMENVAQGISVVDADMKLVAWNRRYTQMFDYPDGFIYVGRDAAELIRWNALRGECGPGDAAEHVRKRLAYMRSGSAYVIQRERQNGRVYEIRGQPLPGGGYVTTYTDITEYKQTELALRESKLELESRVEERTVELKRALEAQQAAKRLAEEANTSKTRFFAAASHDLLQPLNAARLFASALSTQASEEPALREIAARIDSSMRAAEDLLDGLLDVARLDSGALSPERTAFPIADLLADLERQYAPVAAARQLELRVVATRAVVYTDRVLLRRILQNYLANALRYTRRGGVLLGCVRRGGDLLIRVCDTGPGIAEHQRGAIFGEFTRLERASPWGEKGLGLGLAICDRIARLLGHPLDLRSRPGHGSSFGVVVPRAALGVLAGPGPTEIVRDAGAALDGLVVLCVDNEPAILDGMEALLSRWGIEVLKARDAAEAQACHAQGGVDIVLADYHLGDGPDGLAMLAELAARAPLTAALITADYDVALAARARALGWPVLRKPVKPAALRAFLTAARAGRVVAQARAALG